ncbi:MlaD family protein [Nocardia huaxiensis]|uniref:Mammalian cell entry protein n=1 Tax=Nocardia huaxiensis TaxID=2755382 RepID=A0A7D6Z8G1_9NOCA|nr:MlaD family protein [Nocardia huaxiensis]QLY27578.1 mammalian cell entry protein [Nocardia huaxiensis]UFS99043.1 mammalian cell entry protein [Nocardia huaxiensis]
MPNYAIPGVRLTRRISLALGVLTVVLAVLATLSWRAYTGRELPDRLSIQLRTEQTGEGIVTGTTVRYDGVAVGRITGVEAIGQGRQLLTLDLDRSQTAGLTDAFTVDYAPENLFGISTVALRAAAGGMPLQDGQVIDLTGRAEDVTMGALLRTITQTATEVLTPKLSELITQFNTDLRAFTPILQAVISVSRAIADTQRYPSSFLIDQYSSFLEGFGDFTSATFKLAAALLGIEIFQTERDRYNVSIGVIRNGVLLGAADLFSMLRTHFNGLVPALTPTLNAVTATVPDPERSAAELTEMLERLHRIFADTPDGPVVNVEVALQGIPGVAVPLLSALTGGAR